VIVADGVAIAAHSIADGSSGATSAARVLTPAGAVEDQLEEALAAPVSASRELRLELT
jgi:hypothetical protein